MDNSQKVKTLLTTMESLQISFPDFVFGLVSSLEYQDNPIVLSLTSRIDEIIRITTKYSRISQRKVEDLTNEAATSTYISEIANLVQNGGGLHFNMSHANTEKLEEFSIKGLAQVIRRNAPRLWEMLVAVMSAHSAALGTGDDEDANIDVYWDVLDGGDIRRGEPTRCIDRQKTVAAIKMVVIISIMAQNANRRANYLQSMLGIFLQSAHAPQKVVETLAHMGLSVSLSSINAGIRSLSQKANHTIQKLGYTLLASYAYDNFDVDMKTSDQRVEKSNDSLVHLTSGLLFPLQHGITKEDLCCSRMLWEQSIYNIEARGPVAQKTGKTYRNLLRLHERNTGAAGMSLRGQYNAWRFLSDLIEYGPEYFRRFRDMLGEPEVVDAIPAEKTPIIAARTMRCVNSTVSGNIESITGLLAQAGITDPMGTTHSAEMPDVSDYVVLFHGDLGTGERIQALLQRRAMETTPWRRCQYVIFVPGLFHLKMAAADAIWRAFLQPVAARGDETALLRDVAILRPTEIGHYQSKPGFRRMHQLITYSGICRRLNCWVEEVAKTNPTIPNLDAFAAAEPSFAQLKEMAGTLAQEYVATPAVMIKRRKPHAQRDMQQENALILNKYLLLYEELTYAMNTGDIGRVETCIVAWILVFKATGKHKYATHMTEFLMNVHFVYPNGLRHAIRSSILINPTGKKGKFRAVDWCVELNNLFTKVINGGKFSNYTIDRIILESPLVQVYRNLHESFQKHFLHTHLSSRRNEANMVKTFMELCMHLEKHRPYKTQLGRSSKLCISELIDTGHVLMEKSEDELAELEGHEGAENQDETSEELTLDDVVVEMRL